MNRALNVANPHPASPARAVHHRRAPSPDGQEAQHPQHVRHRARRSRTFPARAEPSPDDRFTGKAIRRNARRVWVVVSGGECASGGARFAGGHVRGTTPAAHPRVHAPISAHRDPRLHPLRARRRVPPAAPPADPIGSFAPSGAPRAPAEITRPNFIIHSPRRRRSDSPRPFPSLSRRNRASPPSRTPSSRLRVSSPRRTPATPVSPTPARMSRIAASPSSPPASPSSTRWRTRTSPASPRRSPRGQRLPHQPHRLSRSR